MNGEKILNHSLLIVMVIVIGIAGCTVEWEDDHPWKCVSETTVEEIMSLEYRDATIKLANGQTVSVNQARLKKGDKFCVKRERT